jgi:transcriptional regulator with XRE-family HTH domain
MSNEDYPDDLALSRQTLADLLAALRKAAGLTQQQVADHIGFSRATVAGAETCHRQASAAFWARCDDLLATRSELRAAYAQLAAARRDRERRLVLQAEAEREERLTRLRASGRTPALPATTILRLTDDDRSGFTEVGSRSSVSLSDGVDWPAWFGLRLAGLFCAVDSWPDAAHCYDLQALLHQEILMLDAEEPEDLSNAYSLSRRQALVALASLPLPAIATGQGIGATAYSVERFLARCAASLTGCWHLLRGSDLDTVEQLLSKYILPLGVIARQSSRHRQIAARLASQAHRICGIVALHRNHVRLRERHCQQALHYARIGGDASTEAAALISLASTYFYQSQPGQATALYESGLAENTAVPRLQQSRLCAELSVVYGQLGRERDALRCSCSPGPWRVVGDVRTAGVMILNRAATTSAVL